MLSNQNSITEANPHLKTDVIFAERTAKKLALQDIFEGFAKWRIWSMLAYHDIKLRYRRSILGPFWITISMAITVYTMGFLYAHLFHIELQRYYPFLVAGMLAWSLISTLIVEMCDGWMMLDNFIKQIKLPYSLYIHRIAARNMLIFFHNIIVIIPILIIFHEYAKINLNTILLLPGLFIIYINSLCFGLLLGIIGARYRDISQMIKASISIIFFITPILWSPERLGEKYFYLVNLNPFYAYIELIRAPLMGQIPTLSNLLVVTLITVFGILFSLSIFARYRARIIYWV